MARIQPNLFLIGVQKSATTSVYDWIAQHPQVCGPVSMKDTPFFIDDELYSKGTEFLDGVYQKQYQGQEVIINGSAHNVYFEHAMQRIKAFNPEAKLILILRNPVDRAISAYYFARKRNLEKDELRLAIEKEKERLKSTDLKVLSETTYIDHGLYYKQLKRLYQYFSPEQTMILFYEDIKNRPEEVIRDVYIRLGVDQDFKPEFRSLNKTGQTRFKWIKNLIYNDSRAKKFLLKNLVDKIIPYDLKYRIKIFFLNLITSDSKAPRAGAVVDKETRDYIKHFFEDDISNLELMLEKDLSHWKN